MNHVVIVELSGDGTNLEGTPDEDDGRDATREDGARRMKKDHNIGDVLGNPGGTPYPIIKNWPLVKVKEDSGEGVLDKRKGKY